MELTNFMEEWVKEAADRLLAEEKGMCKCPTCKQDVVALSLNRLPPRYSVTDLGSAYVKLQAAQAQFNVDLVKVLTKAIQQVRRKPRHLQRA